ncbi:MAG TPA: TonB-dependent receptor [Gemmatimonadales bacterium]|nr:TonB-dependent receptor [Gemmatimonadales bacterium]
MKTAALLVTVVLFPAAIAGQGSGSVSGAVSDTAGLAVRQARVRVRTVGPAPRLVAITMTSAEGAYRVDSVPAGRVIVDVATIGYFPDADTIDVTAGQTVVHDVRLRLSPVTLLPTIVTAAKRSQLLDQAITSVSLVSREAISARAVNTVDEAVDKAPGVQFISGQVNIRGSSGFVEGLGSRVLLLVDGVPANQGDRGGIDWDLVPVDQVQRVEVVKGAGSALYGSSAFGGVVNLITRELPTGAHARLRATAGVFADPPQPVWGFRDYTGIQDGLDVSASYGQGAVRAGFAAGARHSDGYRDQDKADHWQVSGRGEWRPEPALLVNLSGGWASNQYQVPEPWCASGQCADSGQGFQPFRIDTANRGNTTRSDKGYFTALVTRTPSARIAWSARLSWLRNHFTDVYPGRQPPFAPTDFAVANRYGGEARLVTRRDTDQIVTVGVEAAHSDVTSNVFSGDTTGGAGRHMQDEYAAYAEAEQAMGPLRATLGARGDFLTIDAGGVTAFVSPRGGLVWPTRTGTWRASIGRAYRAPSLAERFVTTYALGFRVIPNPALRAEDGWTAELGRSWSPVPWLRGDAAIFWTEARHLIEPATTPSLQIQFQNLQRARLAGLDCNVTAMSFGPHMTTTLAYLYLDALELAHDTVPERPLLYRPRHLVTVTADYSWRSVGVGADLRYSSRFERQDPLFPGDPQLGATVLDLRASWRAGPLEAHLKVANALNYIYNLAPRVLEPVRTTTLTVAYTY